MNGHDLSLELDPITARRVTRLAETWGVSEEEAVRRAVEQANVAAGTSSRERRLEAFKELQRSLNLTPAKAAEWQRLIREARR
jgi:hypothetical protein